MLILGHHARFVTDSKIILAQKSGNLIQVDLENNCSKHLLKGEFEDFSINYWDKSSTYIAVRVSLDKIIILNYDGIVKETIGYKGKNIGDVLCLSEDVFLVLFKKDVALIDRNNLSAPHIIELLKNEDINMIYSGAVLDDNHFFLHIKTRSQDQNIELQGRIYDIQGKVKRKISIDPIK